MEIPVISSNLLSAPLDLSGENIETCIASGAFQVSCQLPSESTVAETDLQQTIRVLEASKKCQVSKRGVGLLPKPVGPSQIVEEQSFRKKEVVSEDPIVNLAKQALHRVGQEVLGTAHELKP